MALDADIRRYEPQDQEESREIIRSSVKTIEGYSVEKISHLKKVLPDMVTAFASDEGFRFYVAEANNEITGLAGLETGTGTIGGIFVRPEYKQRGIGTLLINRLEKEAREADVDEMKVSASISAKKFYEKNGFRVTEKDTDHEIENKTVAVYKMKKDL
jgi:N-acetylglutamate synthase and related acetyltransferases